MYKFFVVAVFAILMSGCTKPDESTRALEASGYRDIVITGYDIFGCDEKDLFHTSFKAVGADGKAVNGVVCGGIFKGSTIRVN